MVITWQKMALEDWTQTCLASIISSCLYLNLVQLFDGVERYMLLLSAMIIGKRGMFDTLYKGLFDGWHSAHSFYSMPR